jgi:hypothetical protein
MNLARRSAASNSRLAGVLTPTRWRHHSIYRVLGRGVAEGGAVSVVPAAAAVGAQAAPAAHTAVGVMWLGAAAADRSASGRRPAARRHVLGIPGAELGWLTRHRLRDARV